MATPRTSSTAVRAPGPARPPISARPAVGVALAAAPPVAAALLLAWAMPRGPMTTGQSFAALAVALAAGFLAGLLLRSRWAALLAPVVCAATLELTRLPLTGPTVGPLRADSVYAVLAMVAGRGFDGLVVLLPMSVAAGWCAWVAARRAAAGPDGAPHPGQGGRARPRRRPPLALLAATTPVVVLAAALARPATTEPVVDADGSRVPGSVAELVTVPVRGHDLAMMVRGRDTDAPVLLFLEGGPGGSALGSMRYAGEPLEDDFVVVTLDQRGTGRSADEREPVATLTVEDAVADVVAVIEHLCARFGEDGVYLVGSSWGTTLGTLVTQARPDLVTAYVGSGQMVDQGETDVAMWEQSLADARASGDEAFADRLAAMGAPPYDDPLLYPLALSSNPRWHDYRAGEDHDPRSSYPMNLFVAEYTLTEQVRAAAGLIDTFAALYPQLQDVDFRTQVPSLAVPVWVVQGAHEADGRDEPAREWFAGLDAPEKHLVTFDSSGHTPHLDEPGRFAALMAQVRDATS